MALVALEIGSHALPDYCHRFSANVFTRPQLLACLVLKQFFKTDYRGIIGILGDNWAAAGQGAQNLDRTANSSRKPAVNLNLGEPLCSVRRLHIPSWLSAASKPGRRGRAGLEERHEETQEVTEKLADARRQVLEVPEEIDDAIHAALIAEEASDGKPS